MHLNELNHRSPLRLFERSVHGGLGRGNLGIVVARAGVGKSGFLTCLALDDLLRGEQVLHVTTNQTVEHVRDFYDEIFNDLAREANLEESVLVRDQMESHRIIRSLMGQPRADRLASTLDVLREVARFRPGLIVLDGYDFERAAPDEVGELVDVARRAEAELWMSMRTVRKDHDADWRQLPEPVARVADVASVIVLLEPQQDGIRIRLLKDRDNTELAELTLDLDPRTFLVKQS